MSGLLNVSVLFLIFVISVKGEFSWSSPDYAAQASRTTCKPLQKYDLASLKSSDDVKRVSLGAVDNPEVCGGLCCEIDTCDLAEFNKDRQCYAVQCANLKNCDVASNGDSVILTFTRKDGNDVWTRSFKGEPASTRSNIANESPESILTSKKNELLSVVQQKPIMDSINEEEIAHIKKLENQLEKKWTMEEMAKADFSKQTVESKKDNIASAVGKEIQSITGEQHYLKADDKGDITALQENDTSTAHSKSKLHKHDARHNIISPITIGAFTCMAVIAVSGFAMAIIKYNKERKEMSENKEEEVVQTEEP